VSRASDDLTPEQWGHVEEAVPEARALARSLARGCKSLSADDLGTLAEDSLRRRVRHFDVAKNKKLMAFAGRFVRKDLLRAANRRAEDPCVSAGLDALDRHEETIESPDLATRFAETREEKGARARAQGAGLMGAGYYAYASARAARTPEDELASREAVAEMKRDAEATVEGGAALLDLVYVQELPWEEVAAQLGVDLRQAQRMANKVIARLRRLAELRAER
jgi:DNA-directed RNA polymerase specialized sigma subunit